MHGGALESFKLVKGSELASSCTAVVTFTTGSAAQAYYEKYPNGLEFKFNTKRYVAFVEMGEKVDVISSLMRGYLESGATRVVRASGVEEDWAMRALRKMAEGKGRQVEAIIDVCKDAVRRLAPCTRSS